VGINVEGRDVKSLVKEIQSIIDNKLVLPSGYYIRYGGAFENLDRASKRLVIVVPIALVLIFLLVFFAVKSIKQTLIIYIAIPLSAVGGVLSLWLRDMPFSISAGVGFIVLFGVAILNGLVLINGFNEMRNSKKYSLQDTIVKGSIRRIRPILLTATTDILGFLPMAISVSAGAEIQRPLATVVIGGMLTSTLLTLVVLPVLYKLVYTKKNNNKTNRQSVIVASVMFLMLLFVPSINNAQPIISIEQAVDTALSNYPSIKVSELQIDKQQAMKNTFLKFGSTTIYTGKEEVGNNSLGINNRLGIQQDNIDVFSFGAEKKIINSQTKQAKAGLNLTQAQLKKMVCQSYYNAVYYKKQWLLLKKIDTVYENFEKAAKLRYETQQTSKIAYLSASAKYNELKLKIKRIEGAYEASLLLLNQYLMNSEKFDVDATLNYERILFQTDTIKNNPELEYYLQGIDVAKQKWKKEKTSLYPKINVSYTLQSINNNQGYYAWQAGVTLPLVFFSQAGKIKAAKIDYSITEQQFAQKQIELQSRYSQLYKKYITIKDILEYYISSALPLAKEQIEATNLAYKLGSIDYVQFIQNTETAINTSMQFYKQENEFLLLYAELEYLSGK
jgi:cobalt-zinc-cadmium resistance protein CzcA